METNKKGKNFLFINGDGTQGLIFLLSPPISNAMQIIGDGSDISIVKTAAPDKLPENRGERNKFRRDINKI